MGFSSSAYIAVTVTIAALLVGAPAAAAIADTDEEAIESRLAQWLPSGHDSTWQLLPPTVVGDDSLGACAAGQSQSWTVSEVAAATMWWMRCGTAEAAQQRLSEIWADSALYPDPSNSPALGEGVELTARALEAGGVTYSYRLWTQGGYYLAIARPCSGVDPACGVLSAEDARSLMAVLPGTLNRILTPERPVDDPLATYSPNDGAYWAVKSVRPTDTTVDGRSGSRCSEGSATSFMSEFGESAMVFSVECGSLARAQELVADYWPSVDDDGLALFTSTAYDGVSRLEDQAGTAHIMRWWVQGTRYVQVDRRCIDGDEARCEQLTADYARAMVPLLPGVVETTIDFGKAIWSAIVLVGVPIATYFLILVPRRTMARRRQADAAPAEDAITGIPYVAVDEMVRRARVGRFVRRAIVVVVGTVLSVGLIVWVLPTGTFVWQLVVLFIAPLAVFLGLGVLLDLVWKPNRLVRPPRPRGRPSLRAVLAIALRAFALVLAAGTVVFYVLCVLLAWTSGDGTADGFRAQMEAALEEAEGVGDLYPYAMLVLVEMWRSGWIVVFFFVAVATPVFLAYLLDRVGRRLARRSLQDTLAQDSRAHFLYLRGFDEDRLRIDESLGRRGFLELFSPFGRPRFEEVLADQLSAWGPVIAVSGSKQRLQDLGAAKVSLGGDTWQDQVRAWVAGARAVVLSATPSEVREGLEWEIAHLASLPDAPAILLVISPWPRDERTRRWEGFLSSASAWSTFQPLVGHVPASTNILTFSGDRGWIAYGADRRWDWSYAASIVTAIEAGDLDSRPVTPEPTMAGVRPEPV